MYIRNGVSDIISRVKDLIAGSFIFKSLQFRIFLFLMLLGTIPTLITRSIILRSYESTAVSSRSSDVSIQSKILSDYLLTTGYLQDVKQDAVNAEIEQTANLYDGRIFIINKDLKVIKDTFELYDSKTIITKDVIAAFHGINGSSYDSEYHYIEVITPIIDAVTGSVEGVIVSSASTDYIETSLATLQQNALVVQVIITIIMIVLSVLLSRLLVKPFGRVTQAISGIQAGYDYEPVNVRGYYEMDSIISALNRLLGRMKVLDDSREEFVSNVSHELKTPLTSMKVLADSLVTMGDAAPVEMYREFMQDIVHEIDRENDIISDLLSLVKMDKTGATLNIKTVNINEMVELILKRLGPIAEQNGIELIYESIRQVDAEIDEVKLTLAFSNLVENAIKYNRKGGWVRVVLDADHQFFMLNVTDSGIGIPQESLDHVFERFYRVDKSHSREIGGTGLGLAITRSAIVMHRGAVKVSSELGQGTEFNVRIPLIYLGENK